MMTEGKTMQKSMREQVTEVFMDRVAELFDDEQPVSPDDLVRLHDGEMTMRRLFELIRLGK
jgi:hypothetical protein